MAVDLNSSLITVTKLPVIEEELRQLKESWDQKAKDAAALVCTEETVQQLKSIRTEMRKEFDLADSQRKQAKAQYLAPWDAVEATFKECVKDAFVTADTALKNQITSFEGQIKADCRQKLEKFFNELCLMENIDFLTFDQAMQFGKISIGLADAKRNTPTKLQDQVAEVVAKIADAMDQIRRMDNADEIMAEFKSCLDAGKAVSTVQERHRRIEAEKEAAEARKAAQERFKAAEDKVQAVLPPSEADAPVAAQEDNDPVFSEYTFTVYGARKSQLIKIREFMKQEGINYGK